MRLELTGVRPQVPRSLRRSWPLRHHLIYAALLRERRAKNKATPASRIKAPPPNKAIGAELLPLLAKVAATVGASVGTRVSTVVGGAFTRVPKMMLTLVPASSDICHAESVVAASRAEGPRCVEAGSARRRKGRKG